jgi:uncharacterized repeat protein (TIGR02543 family)
MRNYTVTFDSEGGSAIEEVSVEKGGKVERPADPTKEGYIFAGWLKDGVLYDFETKVVGDITLKANWRAYGIDFDLSKNQPLVISGVQGNITSVTLDGKNITADVVNGQIAYQKAVSYGLGVHDLSVTTTEKTYMMELTVASYVISDSTSLDAWYSEVKTLTVSHTAPKLEKQLYVVVSEDFTYTGTGDGFWVWPAYNGGVMNGIQTGVFDGRGHIIKGLKVPYHTVFSVIQGTIKNIAFVDMESNSDRSYGLLARFIWGGRLENVYISGEAIKGVEDIIAGGITYDGNAPVIENCIFNVDFGSTQGAVFYNSGTGEETQTTFTNVYAISGMKTALVKGGGSWEIFPYADIELLWFVEMNMQNSLFLSKNESLYFNQKKLL